MQPAGSAAVLQMMMPQRKKKQLKNENMKNIKMINANTSTKIREVCKRPSEYDSVEFGPDRLQQLRVEEVLTQAECAPVTSAHAAQPGVAEERHRVRTRTHANKHTDKRDTYDKQKQS